MRPDIPVSVPGGARVNQILSRADAHLHALEEQARRPRSARVARLRELEADPPVPPRRHPPRRPERQSPAMRGLRSRAEEDSNLGPVIPDQALNLPGRHIRPCRTRPSVLSGAPDRTGTSDDADVVCRTRKSAHNAITGSDGRVDIGVRAAGRTVASGIEEFVAAFLSDAGL
jgi:hypothetical protein